jgi:hypothetical protein
MSTKNTGTNGMARNVILIPEGRSLREGNREAGSKYTDLVKIHFP